ncbi:LptA/OstA family protein [uncultured Sphingomonas sp.]|uniref:LptA/OstA family protein n=1 Tax=uncultured Sphingomonas sp. TaxID=158754 RepID=UPI0025F2BB68|nr:LptA/OstA family protein [uncultured Sphingomonas sp.]
MTRALAPLALGLPLLLAAVPAFAQARHDSNAPIDFDARNIQLDDKANRAILSGGVVIKQSDMTLRAARVTVAYSGSALNGSPQASRLDATGGVTVTRPNQTARSSYAVYDVDRRIITMIGNVTLQQAGSNVANAAGPRLTINLDTSRATFGGAPAGPTTQNSGGRVTGRFSVPNRDAPKQ